MRRFSSVEDFARAFSEETVYGESGRYARSRGFWLAHLDEILVLADVLEDKDRIYEAQNLRAMVKLFEGWADADERSMDDYAKEAYDALHGEPPPSLWGNVRSRDGGPWLSSLYAKGFESLPLRVTGTRRLVSGDTLTSYTTRYVGRNWAGRARGFPGSSGFLKLHPTRRPRS